MQSFLPTTFKHIFIHSCGNNGLTHILNIFPHTHRALRDMIINTTPPTMTGGSTGTNTDTTTPSLSTAVSLSSAPSSAPSSLPIFELDGNASAVNTPGIEEGDSAASSPLSVTPGQRVLIEIALVTCAALAIGLLDIEIALVACAALAIGLLDIEIALVACAALAIGLLVPSVSDGKAIRSVRWVWSFGLGWLLAHQRWVLLGVWFGFFDIGRYLASRRFSCISLEHL
jgi:hypothetical protein